MPSLSVDARKIDSARVLFIAEHFIFELQCLNLYAMVFICRWFVEGEGGLEVLAGRRYRLGSGYYLEVGDNRTGVCVRS